MTRRPDNELLPFCESYARLATEEFRFTRLMCWVLTLGLVGVGVILVLHIV